MKPIYIKPSKKGLKLFHKFLRNQKWIKLYLKGVISKEALEGKNIRV